MPHLNIRYDPDWKVAHDRLTFDRDRAFDEMRRLYTTEGAMDAAHIPARADFNRHFEAWSRSFETHHRTVQEYADWVFTTFPVGEELEWLGQICPVPCCADMRTVEEVNAEWSRMTCMAETAARDVKGRLATRQPDGILAFADPRAPKLRRYWRDFSARDLHPAGIYNGSGARALLTVDEQTDGLHVCFMHEAEVKGVSVTNCIEWLATCIFREARGLSGSDADQGRGFLSRLANGWATRERRAALRPDRFHFYQHTVPLPGMGEKFDRVVLRFENGEFRCPEWVRCDMVPAIIQQARHECATDVEQAALRQLHLTLHRSGVTSE